MADLAQPATNPDAEVSADSIWQAGFNRLAAHFLFPKCLENPEKERRARLVTGFGFLGFFFGLAYASFYAAIGHHWGAAIIILCSLGFLAAPFWMRARQSSLFAGNFLIGVMTFGFTALCCVEGGLVGHALAWLASIPLCALLLVGKKSARRWLFLCFLSAGTVIILALAGVKLPVTYDRAWEPIVSAIGYLGLIVFLCVLGMIFETSREQALAKMRDALTRLEVSNRELINLNNEKNEFLGIAAHDLKNPLTMIILGADMIKATNPAPNHQVALNRIVEAGTRMRDLITQLLDANAIEQGRYISNIERCDLAALAAECITHNQTAAGRKEIALKGEFDGELPAWADRNAAVQICENLISNAVKYSPRNTRVRIYGARDGEFVSVSISDEGPGISEEDQKKMFGKFTRLSAKPTGGESSNGLGLSIVKRLVEAMNGTVTCESRLGTGTTFTVRLPIAK